MKQISPFIAFLFLFTFSMAQNKVSADDFRFGADAQKIGDNCFRLAEAYEWSAGTVWYKNPISLGEPFEMEMNLMLGCDDKGGADGMVFVFYPESIAIGRPGEGMGFRGLVPSLGIEIDTWRNFHLNDPEEDHIALLQHGSVNHFDNLEGPIPVPNLETCSYHKFKVNWNPVDQTIRIAIDGKEYLKYQGDIVNDIFFGDTKVYWGVTAATGRYFNVHEICFEKLEFSAPVDHLEFHPRHAHQLISGELLPLNGAQFQPGNATFLKSALPDLHRLLNLMKANPDMAVEILGHTDDVGEENANKALSEKRAKAVADFLISKGIPADKVSFRGLGELYPVSPNSSEAGRAKNRRVEVHLFKPKV